MRTPLVVALACFAQLWIAQSANAQDESPYMKECKEKGVPLPPKWGDPRWRKVKKNLPNDMAFDFGKDEKNPYDETQVWVYGTDKGTCMALPRLIKGEIQLLGIICQGGSGNACFWDNVPIGKDPETDRIKGKDTKGMDPAKIQDGSNLKEVCTDCHRGSSAFIVHPDTPLDPETWVDAGFDEPPTKPDEAKKPEPPPIVERPDWYKPVSGRPGWENPEGTKLDNCDRCHVLPALTDGYCRLLSREIGKTMPPAEPVEKKAEEKKPVEKKPDEKKPDEKKTDEKTKPGEWKPEYKADVEKLEAACNKLGHYNWPK